jgi:Tfp pilus assembly protein PilV
MPTLQKKGFSLVEVLLAVAFFALVISGLVGSFFYGQISTAFSGNRNRASFLAFEGIEALRNIRADAFSNLPLVTNGGIAVAGNLWTLSGSPDTIDNNFFTRRVDVTTVDANTKRATVTVSWDQPPQPAGSVTADSYFTNWQATSKKGGMLVYGNGGTTSDAIQYKTLGTDDAWSSAGSAADVDTGSTNKYVQALQLYSSPTKDEKVLLSRHYNGTAHFIYAQVWNGSSWGSVQQLSTWTAAQNNYQQFSGAYLANGNLLAVYFDNTTTPKYRNWNGSSWGAQASVANIGGNANFIVLKTRPGTNEVMAVFADASNDTNSAYWSGSAWTLHAEHAANSAGNTRKLIDFAWSPNTLTKGALIYSNISNDKALGIKIWTANGTGGGTWTAVAKTTNQGSNLGATELVGRKGADEFVACDKDQAAAPNIFCYESSFTPAWINPTNQTIVAGSQTGVQKSFGIAYEALSGDPALVVYSDNTTTPKFKKYNPTTNTWDAASTSLSALNGTLASVRTIAQGGTNEIMTVLADASSPTRLYTVAWDGTNDIFYTTPSGLAFTSHGTNGSQSTNFWYDFAWDDFAP